MTEEKKIEKVVQQVKDKVLFGGMDHTILDELISLNWWLERRGNIEAIPTFANLSRTEIRHAQRLLKKQLEEEIKKEEVSFLQTMRILFALEFLPGNFKKKKNSNNRINFCMKLRENSSCNSYEELEIVSLLDEI